MSNFREMDEISINFGCVKDIRLLERKQIMYHFKARDLKIFKYLNRIFISDKLSFQLCVICLCYFNRSEMNGGGGAHLFCLIFCKRVYSVTTG